MCATAGWAIYTGEQDTLLSEENAASLSQDAKALYERAVKAYDHVDRDSGVQYLDMAAKVATDSVPLQFVLAARARDRARFYYGVRSLEYYDISEAAVQRVLQQTTLSLEEKRRAEQMLESIRTERELVPSKDKKKEEVGFRAIVIPIAIERAKDKGMEMTPEQINAALGKQKATQSDETAGVTAATPPASGQFPVPSTAMPLASYGVPTEKPAAPVTGGAPGMPMYGVYPGMAMPAYSPEMPPEAMGNPYAAAPVGMK